jgi:hypothetical protein
VRRINIETKRCQYCGVEMPRRHPTTGRLESYSNYRKRKYCQPQCTARARRIGPDQKERGCLQCGAPLIRKRYHTGRPEGHAAFRTRVVCSHPCWLLWLQVPSNNARFGRLVSTAKKKAQARNWRPRGAVCRCGHSDFHHDRSDGLRCYPVGIDCECEQWRPRKKESDESEKPVRNVSRVLGNAAGGKGRSDDHRMARRTHDVAPG